MIFKLSSFKKMYENFNKFLAKLLPKIIIIFGNYNYNYYCCKINTSLAKLRI